MFVLYVKMENYPKKSPKKGATEKGQKDKNYWHNTIQKGKDWAIPNTTKTSVHSGAPKR